MFIYDNTLIYKKKYMFCVIFFYADWVSFRSEPWDFIYILYDRQTLLRSVFVSFRSSGSKSLDLIRL